MIWSEHGDVAMVSTLQTNHSRQANARTGREANFRPFEGAARVFIVEDADYNERLGVCCVVEDARRATSDQSPILTTTNPTALLRGTIVHVAR